MYGILLECVAADLSGDPAQGNMSRYWGTYLIIRTKNGVETQEDACFFGPSSVLIATVARNKGRWLIAGFAPPNERLKT